MTAHAQKCNTVSLSSQLQVGDKTNCRHVQVLNSAFSQSRSIQKLFVLFLQLILCVISFTRDTVEPCYSRALRAKAALLYPIFATKVAIRKQANGIAIGPVNTAHRWGLS